MNEEPGTREQGRTAAGGDDGMQHPAAPATGMNGDGAAPGGDGPQDRAPGTPARGSGGQGSRRKSMSWWLELPILVVMALVLALLIKTFVVQAFFIPSSSMEDTLLIGDKVLVNKLVYDFRPITRGDVVVFNGDGSWDPAPLPPTPPLQRLWDSITGIAGTAPGVHDYIKRVVGVPHDKVACCDARGRITVNGVPLDEKSYLFPGDVPSETHFRVTVPPGQLWVMGDHRGVSYDSRGHMGDPGGGTIPEDKVVGRAFVIVWPVSRWRILPIPATFHQPRLTAAAPGLARPGAAGTAALTAAPAALTAAPAAAAGQSLPVQPAAPLTPLGLGFALAVPLTLLQRRLRRRLTRRRRQAAPGR
jgi:signal peptidase I